MIIGDAKNVKYLANTRQIRSFCAYALQYGYRLQLIINEETRFSNPLTKWIQAYGATITKGSFP